MKLIKSLILAALTGLLAVRAHAGPTITNQPVSAVVVPGQAVSLGVTAGPGPLTYHWLKDGAFLSGQTNSTLNFAAFELTNSGAYSVVASNALGLTVSRPANLVLSNALLKAWGYDYGLPATIATNPVSAATAVYESSYATADGTLYWNVAGNYGFGAPTVLATNALAAGTGGYRPSYRLYNGVADTNVDGQTFPAYLAADSTLRSFVEASTYAGDLPNVSVVLASNVVSSAGDGDYVLYVKADGTLWGLGTNSGGQLGNGTTNDASVPFEVASNVVGVTSAYGDNPYYYDEYGLPEASTLFIKADGTLWGMGANEYGQTGNGSGPVTLVPVLMASNVVAAAAGGSHTLFVKTDGTLWAVGLDDYGQLGDTFAGDEQDPYYALYNPVPVMVTSHVVAVMAGNMFSEFIKTDGSVWSMGFNGMGNPGNLNVDSYTPVSIPGLVGASLGKGSGYDVLAVAAFTPVLGTLTNALVTAGQPATFIVPVAYGDGLLSYQWQFNGVNIAGATNAIYTIASTLSAQAGVYRVKVTNALGSATSGNATLTVARALATVTLGNLTQAYNGSAVSATAVTTPAGLTVNFTYNGFATAPTNAGSYTVVGTIADPNYFGSATNTLVIAPSAPIISQPLSAVVLPGQPVSLSANATGSAPLTYQWLKDGGLLSGQTNSTLNFATFQFINSGAYSVVVSNVLGLTISRPANLVLSNALLKAWGQDYGAPATIATNPVSAATKIYESTYVTADGTLYWNVADGYGFGAPTVLATNAVTVGGGFAPLYGLRNGVVDTNLFDNFDFPDYVAADGTLRSFVQTYSDYTGLYTNLSVVLASNVVSSAGDYGYVLYVKADGTLWGLGANGGGQLGNGTTNDVSTPFEVASNVVSVTTGYGDNSDFTLPEISTLFVKADGTLWGMGANEYDQLGNGSLQYSLAPVLTPVQVASNVVAAAVGGSHSLFVKTDGTLWAVGLDSLGELGDNLNGHIQDPNNQDYNPVPVMVTGNVAAATAGDGFSEFIKTDGSVWFMGIGSRGDPGFIYPGMTYADPTFDALTPVSIPGLVGASLGKGSGYDVLAAGAFAPVLGALTNAYVTAGQPAAFTVPVTYGDGLLAYQWQFDGTNIAGATNATYAIASTLMTQAGQYRVTVTNLLGSVTSGNGTLNVNTTATVSLGGLNQTYDGTTKAATATTTPDGLEVELTYDGSLIAPTDAGTYTVVATVNDPVLTGSATGTLVIAQAPATVTLGNLTQTYGGSAGPATAITTPAGLTVTLTYNGSATAPVNVGSYTVVGTIDDPNYFGSATNTLVIEAVLSQTPVISQPVAAVATVGQPVSLSVTNTGPAALSYQWLKDGVILTGQTNSTLSFAVFQFTNSGSYRVVASNSFGLTLSRPAALSLPGSPFKGWGANGVGQLGNGTRNDASLPFTLTHNVMAAAAGYVDSFYVTADGTLWGMGLNSYGELGDGTQDSTLVPEALATNVVAVAAGFDCTLYVTADGTLWGMGYNGYGELGDGTTENALMPEALATNVVAVAAGGYHSLYVTADGTLWGMGSDEEGQLGAGAGNNILAPVALATNVVTVAAGGQHSLYVTADGTLWGMGSDYNGELGIVPTGGVYVPEALATNVTAVAAGSLHSLYVTADGTLWTMGYNNGGQLGDGTTEEADVPQAVATGVVAVGAEDASSLYVTADGALWGMGFNPHGELGDGNTANSSVPVLVNGGGLVCASLATGSLTEQGLAVAAVLPVVSLADQAVTAGQAASFTVAVSAGDGPFTYQWQFDGADITGATNDTYTIASTANTDAGEYQVVVAGVAGVSASASANLSINQPVAQVSLDNLNQVYDGSPKSATASTSPDGLAVDLTYNGSSVAPTDAGTYTVVATVDDPNYTGSTTGTLVIAPGQTSVSLGMLNTTYDGQPQPVTASSMLGNLAVDVTYDGSPVAPTAVGTYLVVATVDDPNYTGSASGTLVIASGQANVILGMLEATYDGEPQPATASSPIPGLIINLTYDGSASPPVNVGSYTVVATVDDPNYTGAAIGTLTIHPFHSYVELDNLNQVYDGNPEPVTINTTPNGLNVVVTYNGSPTAPTAPGNYTVVATLADPNYDADTATGMLLISPATASVSLDNLDQIYDGLPEPVIAYTVPLGLNVTMTYNGYPDAPINAGSYNVIATVDDPNYTGNATDTLLIEQAPATVTLGNLSQTYDGVAEPASATTTPAGLTVDLTYNGSSTAPTNAGTYAVVGAIDDPNYFGSASDTLVIATGPSQAPVISEPIGAVVAVGQPVSLSVTNLGPAVLSYQWLKDGVILTGQTNNTLSFAAFQFTNSGSYRVVASNSFGLALSRPAALSLPGSPLKVWGWNSYGQLGSDAPTMNPLPFTLTGNVVAAAPGYADSLYVTADGTLWGVGENNFGELGDGTEEYAPVPEALATNVVAVAGGYNFFLYVTADGTLWGMGYNNNGELGDGTTEDALVPEALATNVVAVAAGGYHSLYVTADGTLWGMGINAHGELGDGTRNEALVPEALATNVTAVAAGLNHSLYVTADGTLRTMGFNYFGQLGDGMTADADVPQAVATGVVAVAAEATTSLYVTADGALWGMGYNPHGELGDGNTANSRVPVLVNGGGLICASLATGSEADQGLAVAAGLPVVSLSDQAVNSGQAASFTAALSAGDGPFTYQWQFDGVDIADATNETYTIASAATTDAGEYQVVVTGVAGLSASATGILSINQQVADVGLNDLNQVYDGSPEPATAITSPGGLAVDLTYDGSPVAPTAAGTYLVVATVDDPNYAGSTTGILVIAPGDAGLTLGMLNPTYDGEPQPATASSPIPGLIINITYDGSASPPVNVGSYTVVASVDDPNYTGITTGTLVIHPFHSYVELDNLNQVYDGNPEPVTINTTPNGLNVVVTYNGSPTAPTAPGNYTVVATLADPNYDADPATGMLLISPAPASVSLDNLDQIYDGLPEPVIAYTVPLGLNVTMTYNGYPNAPINAGSYNVIATVNDPNYTGTTTGTFLIEQAPATVTLGNLSQTYDGVAEPASATTTPAGLTVDLTYDGSPTAPTNAGTYAVVGTIDDPNYSGSATDSLVISPATASLQLTNLSLPFTGGPRSPTVVTTPAGLAVALTYNGSASTPTNVGSYTVVATVSDPNYTGDPATNTFVILATLTAVTPNPNGTGEVLTFAVIPGAAYVVQASTDLSAWTRLGTFTGGADGTLTITDTAAPPTSRFYLLQQ